MTETAAAPAASRTHRHVVDGVAAAARAMPVALLASLPGLVFSAGFDHLAYGLGILAGIVLAGLLVAPRVARSGGASMAEAIARRFGKRASIAATAVTVLVVLPLLTAELALVGRAAEAGLGVPYLAAVLVAIAASVASAVFSSERVFRWMAIGAFALFAAALLVPLMSMAAKSGAPIPQLAFGQALTAIVGMEEKLVENGLVDFDTFSMHTTPFLRLTALDLVALVIALALGTAVLPHLVTAITTRNRPAATRLTGAWAALFAMVVLIAMPALAAYAKLEIYSAMTQETPLSALPAWLESPLRAGLARIHGTSVYLLNAVAEAVRAGQSDAAAVADHLATDATAAAQWNALDEALREVVLASARTLAAGGHSVSAWDVYLTSLLPAAAAAAGNEPALLTQAALVIEPAGLLLALPGLAGSPTYGAPLLVAGVIALAVVVASAMLRTVPPAAQDARDASARRTWRSLAPILVLSAFAAALAATRPSDLVAIVVSALSLAAAGLFPVLAIGLAWKRATAAGAVAAILLGGGVALYYDVGIQVFPAAFYETWAPLSNAGEYAAEEFASLAREAHDAENDAARTAAREALDTLARGTATRRGLANWFGIDSASGAVFGVPFGILALVVVSLLTRRSVPQP